jgi:hypothetical protein
MQASAEHQLVLSPSNGAHSCGLEVYYTAKVDELQYAPTMILNVSNPRILLLFRFINDAMSGADVIAHAVSPLKEKASDAADAKEVQTEAQGKPLNLILNIKSIDIILPTGQTTNSVLNVSVGEIVLATPGSALPEKVLDDAELPLLNDAINESLVCAKTYLYADFSRDRSGRKSQDKRNEEGNDGAKSELQPIVVPEVEESDGADPQKDTGESSVKPSKRRRRKNRERNGKLSGVLLFEDQYDMKVSSNANVGVLSMPDKFTEGVMQDGLEDNILARPAATLNKMGKALRGFVGHKPEEESVKPVLEETEEKTQHVSDSEEEHDIQEEEVYVVHDATLALCVVDMKILPGTLIHIPANSKVRAPSCCRVYLSVVNSMLYCRKRGQIKMDFSM